MTQRTETKRGVLIYDGDCGLCLKSVRVLQRAGVRNAFDYLLFQYASSLVLAHGLDRQRLEQELHLITPEGKVLRGFFAVRRACWATPLLWPVALVLSVPGMSWPGRLAYRLVATNRRRLSQECAKK